MHGSAAPSRYEHERERQIAKNQLRLQQLGVVAAADELRAEVKPVCPSVSWSAQAYVARLTYKRSAHLAGAAREAAAGRTQAGCRRKSASAAPVSAAR